MTRGKCVCARVCARFFGVRVQASFIAAAARASPPVTAAAAVRTPGQAALAHKAACLEHGVELYPGTMEKLLEAVVGLGGAGKHLVPPQPL